MRICQHSFLRFLLTLFLLFVTHLPYAKAGEEVYIAYNTASPLLRFGVSKLEHALLEQDIKTICREISDNKAPDVLILRGKPEATKFVDKNMVDKLFLNLSSEGFRIARITIHKRVLTVVSALDEIGAMYGSLDLA